MGEGTQIILTLREESMSNLYHLWVENQRGAEHCDNIVLEDRDKAEEIRKRLDADDRVADYTFEQERDVFPMTPEEVMEDLEPFLADGMP